MKLQKLSKQDLIKSLDINISLVSKIRQLTSRTVNILFTDGHSANFNLSRPVVLQ